MLLYANQKWLYHEIYGYFNPLRPVIVPRDAAFHVYAS